MNLYIMHFPPISYYFQSLKLWTDQHCSQTNLQSFLNVTEQVSTIKILPKHTHVYTAIASSLKGGRRAKHYKPAVCISTNSYPLKSTLHNANLK